MQGVFFRASTQEVARRLGLSGHAINLDDGSVEVLACGDESAIDELEAWLQRGPSHAVVKAVGRHDRPFEANEGFRTG